MTSEEKRKLVQELKIMSFFKDVSARINHTTPNQAEYSFNLIGTNFFLDIVPNVMQYGRGTLPSGGYKLCWEKKQFIWQSYTFFDVIKEVPEEIGDQLLFHINIFREEGEARYKFSGA